MVPDALPLGRGCRDLQASELAAKSHNLRVETGRLITVTVPRLEGVSTEEPKGSPRAP